MRYIITIVWSLLLGAALSYVLASMAGDPFVLAEAGILAAIIAVFVFILGEGLLKEQKQ
ncbi:YjzD family protein [Oceanobacillus sp. CAU 1775]